MGHLSIIYGTLNSKQNKLSTWITKQTKHSIKFSQAPGQIGDVEMSPCKNSVFIAQ